MTMFMTSKRLAGTVLAASALVLGGCASFSADGGFGEVQQITKSRIGLDAAWHKTDAEASAARQRVAELLAKPLSVDDAVQVALLNNRGLQASYAELGISEADLVQASRLPNPRLSFGRSKRGAETEIDRGFHFDLTRLLLAPLVSGIETRRFEQTRGLAAQETLSLASQTRKAWFMAVAADESLRYMQEVLKAADAGEELAARMVQAGNWSRLDHAREQGFCADAALNVAKATQARLAARERLTRLMGLWGDQTKFSLPPRLPELPKSADEFPDIERQAMGQRLDLQALRSQTQGLAKNLGLSKVTRVVNVLEVGATRNSFNDAPTTERGYDISLEIPLFDWGGARVAKSEAIYMQSVNQLAQAAVEARSEVREAYLGYRSSHDLVRHYRDEVVPLRKRISEENQLRYNGMFISVFDLLADAREQITAVNGYIDALRDFWLAQSDLQMALIGKPVHP
ncbi:TolC family protein [Aquabacterium sp.]|uniref:TolC family protein n=1 Tax=Aquabacterium sp. TaxID=1872578 RepID=UPI0024896310|nr:TolC family protein [Aquabacterium sp.]MDI1261505.1 TolC family protein [Aquabacterium sp.]